MVIVPLSKNIQQIKSWNVDKEKGLNGAWFPPPSNNWKHMDEP